MKSLRLLKKRLEESGVALTEEVNEAMFLLPDGSMIDGIFDYGMRSEDHRSIFCGVEYGDYYMSSNPMRTHWDRIHREYKVVRLVPESSTALVKKYQRLTPEQEDILSQTSYEIEKY
jgi:hypothetical protein